MTVMQEGFLEAVEAGQYNGVEVSYIVTQSKDGKHANIVDFVASV